MSSQPSPNLESNLQKFNCPQKTIYTSEKDLEDQQTLSEEKGRASLLTLPVKYKWQIEYLKIKKTETIAALKLGILNLFKIQNIFDIGDTRIREMLFTKNSKVINIFTNENLTLEECNINSNKIYDLQTKKHNENFAVFNPNEIALYLVLYDDDIFKDVGSDPSDLNEAFNAVTKQIFIDKNIKYDDFVKKIQATYELKDYNFLIMKKDTYSLSNFTLTQLDEKNLNSSFTCGMKIYIEKKTKEDTCSSYNKTNIYDSSFYKLFINQIPNVKVIFNKPLDLSKVKNLTVKSYSFDNSLEINPKKTIHELKERISESIQVPVDKFIIKKNSHNGVEIKKYNDTIDKYTNKCLSIYVQYGTPLNINDISLNVEQYCYNYEEFGLYPYKVNSLGLIKANKTWKVRELLEFIEKNNKKITRPKDNKKENEIKLYLRRGNNLKPGRIYNFDDIIEKTDIKENCHLIIQYISKKDLFIFDKQFFSEEIINNKNTIQFIIRIWDQNQWKISEPFEIIIDKKTKIEDFLKNNIQKIYEEKKFEPANYDDLYATKISDKEMYYYIDDIEKMKFYPFMDYKESPIEDFPFMINSDSCLLFIKDISKEFRQPSEEEKEYFYKKSENKINEKAGGGGIKEKIMKAKAYNKFILKKGDYREKEMSKKMKQKEPKKNDVGDEKVDIKNKC